MRRIVLEFFVHLRRHRLFLDDSRNVCNTRVLLEKLNVAIVDENVLQDDQEQVVDQIIVLHIKVILSLLHLLPIVTQTSDASLNALS